MTVKAHAIGMVIWLLVALLVPGMFDGSLGVLASTPLVYIPLCLFGIGWACFGEIGRAHV